jgi:hypothetical protein
MKELAMAIAVLMSVLWSGCGYADELTIQFQSGKTQRVTLDETVDAVENIQAETIRSNNGDQMPRPNVRYLYVKTAAEKAPALPKNGTSQQDKKDKSKWNWAPPKGGE